MALNRPFEEHEVSPEIRKIYAEVRAAFDLPFVPTLFKAAASCPEYMKVMWRDLEEVASSREFQAAAVALDEFIRSEVVSGGWKFGDQERMLASQKISTADMAVLAGVVGVFMRSLPRVVLFARLVQRGYSGGQKGRVTPGKQHPALSRLVTLHIPPESDAGMRAWLLFGDIKRTTGAKYVPSAYRTLLPFPGYLASVWMDSKKVFGNKDFLRARDEVARRSIGLLAGLPVGDHRELGRRIEAGEWHDVEEMVDGFSRLLPQWALIVAVWQRSFALRPRSRAA
jgi:hypothetical protein